MQRQPVDVRNHGFNSGLKRKRVDVARRPGGTPVVDAAALSGFDAAWYDDAIA
jgi:hypothetical protein